MYHVPHYINGKKVTTSGRSLKIFNPATGTVIGSLTVATPDIVAAAVHAAQTAFSAWSQIAPLKRSRILFQFKNLLEQHILELAEAVVREHGKTKKDAESSVQRGIDVVEFVCGAPAHLQGAFTAEVTNGMDSYSMRQPLGVCVGITPFNFPAMVPLWMFPMAIACGNTFILKPSEKDPSCALLLAELAQAAGVPDGVINVLQGDKETVDSLITSSDVQAISMVGSTKTAEAIYQIGTAQGKRVQAFGGAKNHAVVMPDADLDQAADALVGAAYGSAGERCMAISVVVAVGDHVADELIKKMRPLITKLNIGPGDTPETDIGPLVTEAHWERVNSYVNLGVQEGADLVLDGRRGPIEKGFYFGACLFDNVRPSMRIYQEEIFGPVLCIVRVPDFAQALHLVNTHEYANGTAIFTREGGIAHQFTANVQVGMVGVNVPIPVPAAFHGFGGWKRSMFGDIGMHGAEGIRFYTRLKTVMQRWPQTPTGIELAMPTI